MAERDFNAALRKKLAPSGTGERGAALRPADLSGALIRALRRAAAPYDGLLAEPEPQDARWDITLADVKAALPAHRLLAVLEGPGDARALCVLENALVDALVEVQTTGRVDAGPASVRATTQIDAALSRDFIGLFLSGFSGEMTGQAGVNWPLGLTYGTCLMDDRQLDLLFPDRPCHLISAQLSLGDGAKSGRIMLMVPVTGETVRQTEDAPAGGTAWARRWPAIASEALVTLDAVLLRQVMPLSHLQALDVGDVLEFDRTDLARMDISDITGKPVLRARLGAASGKRAICLVGGAGLPSARPTPPDPPPEKSPAERLIDAAMPGPA